MNTFRAVLFFIALATTLSAVVGAQENNGDNTASGPSSPEAVADISAELDTFRAGLFEAFNRGDYEDMLRQYCHPNVIATWQDGTSGQGYDAVLAEFEKLSKFIDKITVQPETDMRLIYGDGQMVVASGNMHDAYALARGVDVDLQSRWTATMVKEDGKWLLVSFSASTNSFQNEVISLYLRNAVYVSAGIAAVAGLILGVLATLMIARRKSAA